VLLGKVSCAICSRVRSWRFQPVALIAATERRSRRGAFVEALGLTDLPRLGLESATTGHRPAAGGHWCSPPDQQRLLLIPLGAAARARAASSRCSRLAAAAPGLLPGQRAVVGGQRCIHPSSRRLVPQQRRAVGRGQAGPEAKPNAPLPAPPPFSLPLFPVPLLPPLPLSRSGEPALPLAPQLLPLVLLQRFHRTGEQLACCFGRGSPAQFAAGPGDTLVGLLRAFCRLTGTSERAAAPALPSPRLCWVDPPAGRAEGL